MNEINHEYYVSLEVAKLLKNVGFNWEVKTYYHYLSPYDEYNLEFDSISTNYNHLDNADFSAPSLDVALRWLREIKNIWVEVLLVNATDPHYRVDLINASSHNNTYGIIHYADYKEYETPEQAQEAGIKKALEIILKQGE